ncbi:MAG: CotH kinase family protein [Clostridia bacterium]|nr:CotH kinase family protein [Clostridia bacterium]
MYLHNPKLKLHILLAALILLLFLTACEEGSLPPSETNLYRPDGTPAVTGPLSSDSSEPAIEESLPAETTPVPPPTADALDPEADYTQIVINTVYSVGRMPNKALAEASFVELYNNTDRDISLAGAALYLAGKTGNYTAYPFAESHVIPARGYFLIKGDPAIGAYESVFSLDTCDAAMPIRPDEYGFRMAIAPVGLTLDSNAPMCELEGLFTYVSSVTQDAEDFYHAAGNPQPDRIIRKKAATHKLDYQRMDLTEVSKSILEQIRPKTTQGDVNTEVNPVRAEVVFSISGGIYTEPQILSLTAPEGYTVYYTTNGEDPRDGGALTYKTPLSLTDTSQLLWGSLTKACGDVMGTTYYPNTSVFPGGWVIKAYAVRDADGAATPLTTQTYFVGKTFAASTLDMVSVTLAPTDFIGINGIYNNANGGTTEERDKVAAYIEFFTAKDTANATDGRVYAGWSEIAMNGKGSLGMTQKSFRILFKNTIEGEGDMGENLTTMTYDVFGDYASTTPDGERITWYRHLLLRNGGGDMSGSTISRSHFGDAYIQRVDRFLGVDIMASNSVMVYVNGEFWGIYNARDRLDTKYFEGKYGIPEEDFTMLECPHPLVYDWNVDYTTTYGDPAEAKVFMDLISFCRTNDLSIPENYQYVADRVDIDGLIDFFCGQIYLCCSDWPSNNIKVWRNTDPDLMDTKWHFCIVDTDHGVGLNSSVDTNLFGVINDGSIMGSLFNRLCGNRDFKNQFIARFIWCLEFYFEPEWMLSELDDMLTPIRPLMQYQLDRWRALDNTVTSYELWDHYIEVIKDFVQRRPAYAKAQLMGWAGISEEKYYVYKADAIKLWGIKDIHS